MPTTKRKFKKSTSVANKGNKVSEESILELQFWNVKVRNLVKIVKERSIDKVKSK